MVLLASLLPSRGDAPGYINVAPLGLFLRILLASLLPSRGDAPGYINVAPLGLFLRVLLASLLPSSFFVTALSIPMTNDSNFILFEVVFRTR